LVLDAIKQLPQSGDRGTKLKQMIDKKLIGHRKYIDKHGLDMPEIRNWKWKLTHE